MVENHNVGNTLNLTSLIKSVFQNESVAFYPIHGTHDTSINGGFDFEEPNENKEVGVFADAWAEWMDETAVKQYKRYGYYSSNLKFANGT